MQSNNRIKLSVVTFCVIYGLLIVPWPGWNDAYGKAFRTAGNAIFGTAGSNRILYFEPHTQTSGLASIDSRIVLGNRDLADSTGKGPASLLGIDSRSFGWIPTALTIALIVSSPVSFTRRCRALVGGLILVHAFIIGTVALYIWDKSPNVDLITLSPFWQTLADCLEYTFVTQIGASFTVPVIIWLLVAFRANDYRPMENKKLIEITPHRRRIKRGVAALF